MELEQVVTREQADECFAFFLSGKAFPWELAEWQRRSMAETLRRATDPEDEGRYWIARHNSEIIAAGGVEEEKEDRCGAYVLSWGAVHEDHRRREVAQRFLAAFEEYIRSRGGRLAFTETGEQNFPTQKFLESAGYERAGMVPHWYKEGEGKIIYYKVFKG